FHEGEHHVEIVDHKVEHHADVGAPGGVGRETMGFYEARLGGDGLKVFENRIEPFHVTDLQDAVPLLSKLDESSRLSNIIRHRLFHQHVLSLLEKDLGDFEMCGGGIDNADGVVIL